MNIKISYNINYQNEKIKTKGKENISLFSSPHHAESGKNQYRENIQQIN